MKFNKKFFVIKNLIFQVCTTIDKEKIIIQIAEITKNNIKEYGEEITAEEVNQRLYSNIKY